jgi:HPt (histidine-containing phosphotransfer) domain-containing protein
MAHTLRGSSSTLGAAQVAHIASELEQAAKAGGLAPAGALLDALRGALESTRKAFHDRAAEPDHDGVFPL